MVNFLSSRVLLCAVMASSFGGAWGADPYFMTDEERLRVVQKIVDQTQALASMRAHTTAPSNAPAANRKFPQVHEGQEWRRLVIKFRENDRIRLREGKFVSLRTDAPATFALPTPIGLINSYFQNFSPDKDSRIVMRRAFSRSETDVDMDKSMLDSEGKQSTDLNSFYIIDFLGPVVPSQAAEVAARLSSHDLIEVLYFPQRLVVTNTDITPPVTTLLESSQGHLETFNSSQPLTFGIGAKYAWTVPGGTGANVRVVDIENGWNFGHEDLPNSPTSNFIVAPPTVTVESGDRQHGTSTLGVLVGQRNTYGITGIAPDAKVGAFAVSSSSLGIHDVIMNAVNQSQIGDIILLEVSPLLSTQFGIACGCTFDLFNAPQSCRSVPMEWEELSFAAIQYATNRGRVVIEAAANGGLNLDSLEPACFNGRFNRGSPNFKDAGAIFVGAADGEGHQPLSFSNYGSRNDVHSWGNKVRTSGSAEGPGAVISDLFPAGAFDLNQHYRSDFAGTSSASAIIAGAATIIQSVQKQGTRPPLFTSQVRDLMVAYGEPANNSSAYGGPYWFYLIGPQPNLQLMLTKVESGTFWSKRFDIDGDGRYDALTDGMLILRYLFGIRGSSLISGAISPGATRTTALAIETYLGAMGPEMDVDRNNVSDALTDGLMILRYMFGLGEADVVANAVGPGSVGASGEPLTGTMIMARIRVHMPSGVVSLDNASCEVPQIPASTIAMPDSGFRVNPVNAGWTFGGGAAGVVRNGGTMGVPNAPSGLQACYVGGDSANLGSIQQSIVLEAGAYVVSFKAARIPSIGVQPISFSLDGNVVGTTFTPPADFTFGTKSIPISISTSGSHIIKFSATIVTAGNNTVIDEISVTRVN